MTFWHWYFGLYALAFVGFGVFFHLQDRRIERLLEKDNG